MTPREILQPHRVPPGTPFGDEGISFHPLEPAHVAALEARMRVPDDLRRFWLDVGFGHIRSGPDGKVQNLANNFLSPPAIAHGLASGQFGESHPVEQGEVLPFFLVADEDYIGYVLEGPKAGMIVWVDQDGPEIAPSLETFVTALLADPFFYAHPPGAVAAPN